MPSRYKILNLSSRLKILSLSMKQCFFKFEYSFALASYVARFNFFRFFLIKPSKIQGDVFYTIYYTFLKTFKKTLLLGILISQGDVHPENLP